MAFTKALYYPEIEIEDEAWLKNAMLYWEEIRTIVPSSIEHPYRTNTAREFQEEGLLIPYYVRSDMREIEELTDVVMEYLESPEGMELLLSREISENRTIFVKKLPSEIRELLEIYPEKLPLYVRRIMAMVREIQETHEEKISVDSRFADFYMTLLATHLAEKIGAGLLTNKAENNKLANSVRLDARLPRPRSESYRGRYGRRHVPPYLAQGTLVDLIFENIRIDPTTSVREILKFRTDHASGLGHFRTRVAELTNVVSRDLPEDQFYQEVKDIYLNNVKPAIDDLKSALRDCRIKHVTEGFVKIGSFSTVSLFFLKQMIGLSSPLALLVDAGVSLTACAILYNPAKNEILRQNPFSYLMAVKTEL